MNLFWINRLLAAIGALISIGTAQPKLGFFKNMTCAYDPVAGKCNDTPLHLILLFVLIILELLLIYSQCVVSSLYIMLKVKNDFCSKIIAQNILSNLRVHSDKNTSIFTFQDAWLIGVVGSAAFEDNAGLTSGGKRVEA